MFRLIDCEIWDEPQMRSLSGDGMILYLCLLANIHTKSSGIYRIPLDRIAWMIKRDEKIIVAEFQRLADKGLAYYDGEEVCIPGYIKRQHYKGPKMAKLVAKQLLEAKNKDFADRIAERYSDFLKLGGYHRSQPEIQTKQLFPGIESPDQEDQAQGKIDIDGLVAYAIEKLKLSGGIRKADMAALVQAVRNKAEVKAAIDRAALYYETAKNEKWRSFIIAKRFAKFREFFDEAFSSDEALALYIEKIRKANVRESRDEKRSAHLKVGAHPAAKPDNQEMNPRDRFLRDLPYALLPMEGMLFEFYETGKNRDQIEAALIKLFDDEAEAMPKLQAFKNKLSPKLRTPEVENKFKLNYIIHKFNVPWE